MNATAVLSSAKTALTSAAGALAVASSLVASTPATERPTRDEWALARAAQGRVTPADWRETTVLLGYQTRIAEACQQHDVVVVEKSRRTGATWGAAADSVLRSASPRGQGGMDTLYIGTSHDMAKEFIDAAAMWARLLGKTCTGVQDMLFDDGSEEGIKALRIDFASDFSIVALSSRPRSLRGRQGFAILDEAAFADDLNELLKAALAFLIWGGKVLVISTHNGASNPFNLLIEDIRAKKRSYGLVRFTLDDALRDGLFERICLVNPDRHGDWSAEKEADWREGIIDSYGDGADEELYCVPAQGSGVWLSAALIEGCMHDAPVLRIAKPPEFTYAPEPERRAEIQAWIDDVLKPVMRERLDVNLRSGLGFDVARYRDQSIITPIQETRLLTKTVPFVIEMLRIPFQQQLQILEAVWLGLPRRAGMQIDATGIGAQLAEQAAQKWSQAAVAEVKFSPEWWRTAMPPVKAAFEDRAILIPRDNELKSDLRAVRIIHGVAQVPPLRVKAAAGGQRHGDFAPSLALAVGSLGMAAFEFGYQSARAGLDDDPFDRHGDRYGGGDRRDGIW